MKEGNMRSRISSAVIGLFAAVALTAGSANAETLRLLTWGGYAPEKVIEMFKAEGGVDPADSTLPDAAGPPALFEEVPEELEAPDPGNGVPEVL